MPRIVVTSLRSSLLDLSHRLLPLALPTTVDEAVCKDFGNFLASFLREFLIELVSCDLALLKT